jgi:tetratricopeptide (TPR) repeat protein
MLGKLPDDDDAALDELFELAVDARSRGETLDLAALLADRPALRPRAEKVLALAREVAIGGPGPDATRPSIDGFTLLEEVGRGGMGIVYRARQDALGREVAVKVLAPALQASLRARERFALEARTLARLQHPNVVVVHEIVERDDLSAYAMEWIAGTSLALAIATGDPRLQPANVARLGITIAEALTAVHTAGLVHRDVKPANVLLRADGSPVLTDFSLVHDDAQTMHTRTGEFLGTLAYAAPEQLRGEHDRVGPRTDVYGLGATLWSALAGRPPFGAKSASTMLQHIEHGQLPPLQRVNPAVPRDLATIVHTAMDRDPDRRYADAAALAADLRRLLAFEPIHARPAGVVLRTQRWLERSPQLALALLGLFAAVVLGLAATAWLSIDLARQRDAAQAAEARAQDEMVSQQELARFLRQLIRAGDVTLQDGVKDITVRQAVERAAAAPDIGRQSPRVEATLRLAIGELLAAVGRIDAAEPHLRRSFALMQQLHGADATATADAAQQLSRIFRNSGRVDAAGELLGEVVRIRRTHAQENDLAELHLAQALASLGIVLRLQESFAAAEQALAEALEIYRRVLKWDEENVAMTSSTLTNVLLDTGRIEEARRSAERAVAAIRAFHGDRPHGDVAHAEFALATVRWHAGERAASLAAMRAARAAARELVGEPHMMLARMGMRIAGCLRDDGDLAGAADEYAAAAAAWRDLGNGFELASCNLDLADLHVRAGRIDAAVASFTPQLEAEEARLRGRAHLLAGRCASSGGAFAVAERHLTTAWQAASLRSERRTVAAAMVELHTAWGSGDGARPGMLAHWQQQAAELAANAAK